MIKNKKINKEILYCDICKKEIKDVEITDDLRTTKKVWCEECEQKRRKMPKEIREKIIEIVLETSAFNRNSEKFQKAISQILELFDQREKEILEEIKEKYLKEWKRVSDSETTPFLPRFNEPKKNFDDGWKLAINRMCNDLENLIEQKLKELNQK